MCVCFCFLEKEGKKREKKKKLVPLDIIRDHFNIKSTSKKKKSLKEVEFLSYGSQRFEFPISISLFFLNYKFVHIQDFFSLNYYSDVL